MNTAFFTQSRVREILTLSYPIILGNASQMALNLLDILMVGQLSEIHLAASGLANNILAIPYVMGIGLISVISPLVGEVRGSGSDEKVGKLLWNGLRVGALGAVLISAIMFFSSNIIFHLDQNPKVAELGHPFMNLLNFSLIPMILFLSLKQFTDGLEKTTVAMVISLLAIPFNALLNWLLIYGNCGCPELGLNGAGWATLITRTLMFLGLFVFILRSKKFQPFGIFGANQQLDHPIFTKIIRLGIPSSMQYVMEAGAFAFSGIMMGWISAEAQAAHHVVLQVASFTFMISIGLSVAGAIKVGEYKGQNDWTELRKTGKTVLLLAGLYGVICATFFVVTRNILPPLFNNSPTVIAIAAPLMILAAIFQVSDAIQANAVGLLRGIQDVKWPTVFVMISYWVLGIPAGYLLAFKFNMGANGIWIGFITGLSFACVLLTTRFLIKTRH